MPKPRLRNTRDQYNAVLRKMTYRGLDVQVVPAYDAQKWVDARCTSYRPVEEWGCVIFTVTLADGTELTNVAEDRIRLRPE